MSRRVSDRIRLEVAIDAIRRERSCGDISNEDEDRFAQLVAIWASGYLEATCRELLLGYARGRAENSVIGYVGWHLDRVRSPNTGRMTAEIGKFDPGVARELRQFAEERIGHGIDSIVSMRHSVAHGRPPDMSLDRILKQFDEAREFAAKMEELLTSAKA